MSTVLRAMSLGEILDRTFHIYRRQFLALVAVSAIPAVLVLAVHLVDMEWLKVHMLVRPFRQPGIFLWNTVVGLGFYHVLSLVGGAISPAMVKQASSAALEQDCTLGASLRFFVLRWRSYLWISFLRLVAVLVIAEVVATGLFLGLGYALEAARLLPDNGSWGVAFVVLVPSVVGVYLFLRVGACLSLAIPAASLEDLRGMKALGRSWTLTRDSRVRLAFVWVLLSAFGTILSWGLQFLVRWGLIYLYWHLHFRRSEHFYEAVFFLLNGAVTTLVGPLYPIAVTLFYYDQRIRQEGFDIEWMMHTAGMDGAMTAEPQVVPVVVAEPGEISV